jgi:Carboxypeptidase regulatory-like domain
MNAVLRTAIAGALLAAALGAQAPPEDAAPAELPPSRVRGRVVDARSGAILKGAKVVIGNRGALTASAEGDVEGRFDIAEAPSGEQTITAMKSGYQEFQSRIRVPAGREMEDVRIEMNRAAVITGRVTGADGAPLPWAQLRVLQSGYDHGKPRYDSRWTSQTDDRGIFRIWGLTPGDYVVAVNAPFELGPQATTVYTATGMYYPNAPTVSDAARVHLDWGQILEEINFDLKPPAATRVVGSVTFREIGGECNRCETELRGQEGGVWIEAGNVAIRRNSFSLQGLAPGRYVVRVNSWDRANATMAFGAAEFMAIEDRVSRVVVDMRGQQSVSGRVVLVDPPESVVGPEAEPWHATLVFGPDEADPFSPMEFNSMGTDLSGPGAEAAFDLKLVPGRYHLGLGPVPGDGYVRSVSIAGRPIEGRDIDVPNSGLEDVVISIAYDTGKIAGKIDLGKTPPPDVGLEPLRPVVRLIPESGQPSFEARLSGWTKPDGSFEMGGLPPGRYRAFAVAPEDAERVEDPAVAGKLTPWSKQAEVRAGQTTSLDLKPAPRIAEVP